MTYRSIGSTRSATASKKPAATRQKVRARVSTAPADKPAQSLASCCAAAGLSLLTTSSTKRSNSERIARSHCNGVTAEAAGMSTPWCSTGHRSAGWMRSATANSCTSRYCENKATGGTGLLFSTASKYSISAKPARSITWLAALVQASGFCTKRCTAASMARSTWAGETSPTISSAPTAWCSCWRARRREPGSTASMSLLRDCSISRTNRLIALLAVSSDLRSSSNTQARGPRSASGASVCRLSVVVSGMVIVNLWASRDRVGR